jgi:integrase
VGSIFRRGERSGKPHGPWLIAYIGLDGRQRTESSRDRAAGIKGTHADAVRLLNRREGKIAEGIDVRPQTGRLTFDDAIAAVLQDHDINKRRSKHHVQRRVDLHLRPYFGAQARLSAIDTAAIREYIAHRTKEGASAATINRELAVLRRAYRLAHDDGKIAAVPKFPMLDESRNVRQGFLEPEDFVKVRGAIASPLMADVAAFAYATGWRVPSEVLPLAWSQVDMRAGLIRIDPGLTKGGEGRQFPITAALRDVLERRYKELREDRPLVFHQDGAPIKPRAFHKTWTDACTAAKVAGRIPHDMRRSAVRNLERASIPRKVAMQMVGHQTESIYRRYHIVAEADIHEAGARLDAITSTALLLQSKKGRRRRGPDARTAPSRRRTM